MIKIVMPDAFPVTCHTDHVGPGSTFVAIKGHSEDGVRYISHALKKGAEKVVLQLDCELEQEIKEQIEQAGAHLDYVYDTREALAQLSAQAHGYPAKKLKIVGITGTKGKTTSVYLLEHILQKAGYKTALLSTVANKIDSTWLSTELTTQQPDYLHTFFDLCVQHGVEYVVMEVAAQALTLHRVAGIEFDGVIFTNFEPEHAEFYAKVEDYFAAKCKVFEHVKPNAPILVNADDIWGQKILSKFLDSKNNKNFLSFGLNSPDCAISADIQETQSGLLFDLIWRGNKKQITCPMFVGNFNVYNLLGALGIAVMLDIPLCVAGQAVGSCGLVPGRMEEHKLPNGARCFIDYAHTPSSYKQVLSVLRSKTDHLIVVFGAGGERDHSKRPIMGEIASELADIVIITSDNPRSEDPQDIAQQISAVIAQANKNKIIYELDRELAIKKAYELSKPSSIIALLGKGPDEYQLIGSEKYAFSEKAILKSL